VAPGAEIMLLDEVSEICNRTIKLIVAAADNKNQINY
jgi:hypothetical protein